MNSIIVLILGMMFVTYIPRLLPFIIVTNNNTHPYIRRFLSFMPYAMFGALIIPGVFNAIVNSVWISIIAFLVACIVAYIKQGVIWPVLSSIGTAMILMVVF